ncbi:HNH endonuclease [Pseudomonas akapageensis]|uniref:HNH endonuclease n=1 Tax=Pseudomonas akapageensis TaxID=2609961 RepID=UPI00140DC381|nr:HNH endonuclease [Pseudomonas akapageensis]
MEIRVDLSELWGQVNRLGTQVIEFDWTAAAQLDPIDVELQDGKEIALKDLNVLNGLLSVHGRQVLLYIPDQFSPVDVVQGAPEKGKRFHVADCKTLSEMRSKGRFERYVVTNNLSGVFKITGKNSCGSHEVLDSSLLVCKNCLEKLNYQNYCHDSTRPHIWTRFAIAEFFETYSTIFRHLPQRLSQSLGNTDYSEDWPKISAEVRRRCRFNCDECCVNLSEHRRLLHVHHLNGVKSDNSSANLRPLCADCHRKQPMHGHLFISAGDMKMLIRLRREQSIVAADWKGVMGLADLAVHGALLHAQQKGFGVPIIEYEFINDKGVVVADVKVAWPEQRIAICVSDAPQIANWDMLNPVEFIERFR